MDNTYLIQYDMLATILILSMFSLISQHMRSLGKCQEKLDQYRVHGLKTVRNLCYCTEIRTSNLNVCLLKMAWVTYLEFTFMFYFQSRFAVRVLGF